MVYKTLKELAEIRAGQNGNSTFLLFPHKQSSLTFKEFNDKAAGLAKVLIKQGLKKGDKVSLALQNGPAAVISFFGIIHAGGVAVPVNASLKKDELLYLLQDSGSRFLIGADVSTDGLPCKELFEAETELEPGLKVFQIRQEVKGEEKESRKKAGNGNLEEGQKEDKAEDLALILYTSGTTGRPKGVMLTHKNLLSEAAHIREGHELTEKDRVLCLLPLFHINGLVVTLITPLLAGISVVMPPKFSASRFWNWIAEYKVTWFSAVPTILSIILSKDIPEGLDLSSLRFARSASAALAVPTLEEFEGRFGIPVIESYGISEGGSQITTNPMPPLVRKAGSVGLPYGNQIRIVDDRGNPLRTLAEGEVAVKGDNIAIGYYKKAEETEKAFRDGWFYTGDLGYLDEDGYLFLKGRKKELINRAGEKFSPREIDEVLYQLPEVELAAAVGVPDPLYNEEVIAYVKLREDKVLSAEQIMEFCRSKLIEFKTPKKILFTDDFPKGPSGKIQRLKLADRYAASAL